MAIIPKLIVAQLFKEIPFFYGIPSFFTIYIEAHHLTLTWARRIQSTPERPIPLTYIQLSSFYVRLLLPCGLFPLGIRLIFVSFFHHSPACCIFHSYRLFWFHKPNNIWYREHVMVLFTMHFSPSFSPFLSLKPKYSPNTLFSNNLNLYFPWGERQSYKPIQHNRQIYRLKVSVFREEMRRQKILNWLVANIP